ncbi:hypothetical protein [Amycolatopsis granulosa]|uniref:hypothetical protein n=1 Tax=Amycolatopsis granulosa TaxID=185684 RepID=UPI0014223CB2|nr:hypothetical protein [Amycolatopsis granulosa]NIH87701.1 hypothetical protein [Amycolatopsis granulosa]
MKLRALTMTALTLLSAALLPLAATPAASAGQLKCRKVHAAFPGAEIDGTLCEGKLWTVKGWVKDTAADQHEAVFRIRYVTPDDMIPWHEQTYTQDLASTKGKPAGFVKRFEANFQGSAHDIVAQPCIFNGNDGRTCDKKWY